MFFSYPIKTGRVIKGWAPPSVFLQTVQRKCWCQPFLTVEDSAAILDSLSIEHQVNA